MTEIQLKYGRTTFPFKYDESRFDVLGHAPEDSELSDIEIGRRLDEPVGSKTLEDIVRPGETVLIVVPDATRQAATGQILNLVIRRLIAGGTQPHEINVIFATGIHRPVTPAEKDEILTPFVASRIKTLQHNARDPLKIFRVGETSGGIPVELNWVLTEFDHVIVIGGIVFHYFAGFTGGRKLICPGLASAKTISATHKLAFDCELLERRQGVGPGLLDGNPVHEAFTEAAAKIDPSFAISTTVNELGRVVEMVCGAWDTSHRKACDLYAARRTVSISEKRDIVIASCGGYPNDINLIQAHKALDAASHACKDGGTIVLIAECPDGAGHDDFLNWFEAQNSDELAAMLCEKYQVNGQTAWSLLRKLERFDVRIITELPDEVLAAARLMRAKLPLDVGNHRGYIMQNGARNLIMTKPDP